jgi:hypothetical protein
MCRWPVLVGHAVRPLDPLRAAEPPLPEHQQPADAGTEANADGSVDVYFAAEKPEDVPSRTGSDLPDRGFFAYIRYYGPLKAFNEKTWVPNDVELVE